MKKNPVLLWSCVLYSFLLIFSLSIDLSAGIWCDCKDDLREVHRCVKNKAECDSLCGNAPQNPLPSKCIDPPPNTWVEGNIVYAAKTIPGIDHIVYKDNPPCGAGGSNCEEVCVTAPNGKKLEVGHVQLFLRNADVDTSCRKPTWDYLRCPLNHDASQNRWVGGRCTDPNAVVFNPYYSEDNRQFCVTFKNWSRFKDRCAKIQAFYK